MLTLKLNDRYMGVHYTVLLFFKKTSYIQAVVNCIPKVLQLGIFQVLLEKNNSLKPKTCIKILQTRILLLFLGVKFIFFLICSWLFQKHF